MVALAIDTFWSELECPDNAVAAGVVAVPGKRKDPDLVTAMVDAHGQRAPITVELLASCHGLQGHWVSAALRKRLCS